MKFYFILVLTLVFKLNAKADPAQLLDVKTFQSSKCPSALTYLGYNDEKPWASRVEEKWGYSKSDFQADPAVISKLIQLNSDIVNGHFNEIRSQLIDESKKDEPVKSSDSNEILPLQKWLLPALKSGLYLSKQPLDPKIHKAVVLFLPGAGANLSIALRMSNPAFALLKVKKNFKPEWGDTLDPKSNQKTLGFRAYSVMFDQPGNAGLGAEAPKSYLDPQVTMLAIEQVALIFKALYGLPVFIVGRSQGGLQALAASHRYGKESGIYGAVAVNPTPISKDDLIKSIVFHEDHQELTFGTLLGKDTEVKVDPRVWASNALVTEDFSPDVMTASPKNPSLILYGSNDNSYEPDGYLNWLQSIGELDASHIVHVVDHPGAFHDLFDKRQPEVFDTVLTRIVQYMRDRIADRP